MALMRYCLLLSLLLLSGCAADDESAVMTLKQCQFHLQTNLQSSPQ